MSAMNAFQRITFTVYLRTHQKLENLIKTLPLACVFGSCVREKKYHSIRVAEMVKNIKAVF